jgi:hypothetical protein
MKTRKTKRVKFDLEEFEQGQPKFVLFLATLVKVSIFNFEAIGQALLEILRPQHLVTIWSFDLEKFVQGKKKIAILFVLWTYISV